MFCFNEIFYCDHGDMESGYIAQVRMICFNEKSAFMKILEIILRV